MNLFDLPDDGRRSLEALRKRIEQLEDEGLAQVELDGFPSPALEYELAKAKADLAQAEREAMK